MDVVTSREDLVESFLAGTRFSGAAREKLQGDASFRRYERLTDTDGTTYILMDAPPPEDVRPFVFMTRFLREHEFSAPEIFAEDAEHGFLVLEDLGLSSYSLVLSGAELLSADPIVEERLYRSAVQALSKLHRTPAPSELASYSDDLYLQELSLFTDWYLPYQNIFLSDEKREQFFAIWRSLLSLTRIGKQVVVLRDYHADNLMWLENRSDIERVGLLDYQDAVIGSQAYDLVSLLEDARRDVSDDTVRHAQRLFLEANPYLDPIAFSTAYCVLGAQRNLKIIGIFARLFMRDKKPRYLDFLPRVFGHLERDIAHPALSSLRYWLFDTLPTRDPHSIHTDKQHQASASKPDVELVHG